MHCSLIAFYPIKKNRKIERKKYGAENRQIHWFGVNTKKWCILFYVNYERSDEHENAIL